MPVVAVRIYMPGAQAGVTLWMLMTVRKTQIESRMKVSQPSRGFKRNQGSRVACDSDATVPEQIRRGSTTL